MMQIIENYLTYLQEMEAETISTSIRSGDVDPGMESNKSYGFDDKAFMVDEDGETKKEKKENKTAEDTIDEFISNWGDGSVVTKED